MPSAELTRAFIAKYDEGPLELQDTRMPGLTLRISPSGGKSWSLRYRLPCGKRRRVTLGAYPALPVSVARTEAAKLIGAVAAGGDPMGDRAERKRTEQRRRLETVEAIGERYFTEAQAGRHRHNGKAKQASSLKLERRYFDRAILPAIGRERLNDLSRADLQSLVNDTADDMSPSAARHTRDLLHRIYAFATWQEIVDTDPSRFVSAPKWTDRERVLTDDEMRGLWAALTNEEIFPAGNLSPAMTIAIRLAALTLQRRSEVVGMRVADIDHRARTWTIPSTMTKNRRSHVVPLAEAAIQLIDEAVALRSGQGRGSPYIFPSPRGPDAPIGAMALTHAWRRLLPHVRVGDEEKLLTDATPHDLRRTGATAMTSERIGVPRFVVSRVLNHTSDTGGSAVTGIYDRNEYLVDKRRALDAWAQLLTEITTVSEHSAG